MLIVQKYGGTSVGTLERIKAVAERAVQGRKDNNDLVIIVSAMAGETDRFISIAKELTRNPEEREMDMLLSSGEIVSASLLSIALNSMGCKAAALTGMQAGIITDCSHTKAKIEKIRAVRIEEFIKSGYIPVVAGFQGITEESSDITTLGRGGSDLTAVAIASVINADLCEIYTDVDGVYTADPNIVRDARKLDKISYDEMLELASLGAKVLQTRSVEFAKKYNVPLVVRSSFNDSPGTLVTKEDKEMEKVVVSGVACDKNQAKITIRDLPDMPGIAARLFQSVASRKLIVDMIIQNISSDEKYADISFTVPTTDTSAAMEITKEIADELGAKNVLLSEKIAKISIVGVGMRTHSGVAAKMFNTLSANNINIMMISTSEIKISCIVDMKYAELAVRTLHEAFEL